jgi:hypothetical protein
MRRRAGISRVRSILDNLAAFIPNKSSAIQSTANKKGL